MDRFGIIMAGGAGKRFWPLSRGKKPKQLLNLSGNDVLINETIDRLTTLIDPENIYVVTNKSQVRTVCAVTAGKMNPNNVLSEPAARNTAACVAYAAWKIYKKQGDGVLLVTPSDAYIRDIDEYVRVISLAMNVAKRTGKVVTIGIKPTFPATGYGYIHFEKSEKPYKKVLSFVEKPDEKTAQEYFDSHQFMWNSGIFIWKASTVMEMVKKYLPDMYQKLEELSTYFDTDDEEYMTREIYPTIESISIDYGIMEKADEGILAIPADFGWNDVGSFDMLKVFHRADENNNIKVGKNNIVTVNTKDSVIYSSGRLIATADVDNLVIVETKDAILVCKKDKAQDVEQIVDKLRELERKEIL